MTIYTLAPLPALANLDIPNILVMFVSLPRLPTHATPDYIGVLANHSSLDTFNIIISFTTLAIFPTVAHLIILATLPTLTILANPQILPTNSTLYTITMIVCYHIYPCYSSCTC